MTTAAFGSRPLVDALAPGDVEETEVDYRAALLGAETLEDVQLEMWRLPNARLALRASGNLLA